MKTSHKAAMEAWGGTAAVFMAGVVIKLAAPSVLRTLTFIVAIFAATWLILLSIRHTRRNVEE